MDANTVQGNTQGGGIETALANASESLNSFINSVEFLDGTQDDISQSASALYEKRGKGFYAENPWLKDGDPNKAMKIDDIDGQYLAGKITESTTNLVQVAMMTKQAHDTASKKVTQG